MIPAGRPVRRIASRSLRAVPAVFSAARFGKTPGYSAGSKLDSSGLATWLANWESPAGGWALNLSFIGIGMSTSLNRGFPCRDTCT